MKNYIVSKDNKNDMWYAHHRNFPNIPIVGSFSEKKSESKEYAKMYNLLPNKVEKIEQKRKEKFQEEMELTEAENIWINGLLAM